MIFQHWVFSAMMLNRSSRIYWWNITILNIAITITDNLFCVLSPLFKIPLNDRFLLVRTRPPAAGVILQRVDVTSWCIRNFLIALTLCPKFPKRRRFGDDLHKYFLGNKLIYIVFKSSLENGFPWTMQKRIYCLPGHKSGVLSVVEHYRSFSGC